MEIRRTTLSHALLVGACLVAITEGCSTAGPRPELASVSPTTLRIALGGFITLAGHNFVPRTTVDFERPSASQVDATFTVQLEGVGQVFELASVTRIDSESVSARVPAGLSPGLYGLRLTDPRGHEASLPAALTLVP
jgi:hypothetical protein